MLRVSYALIVLLLASCGTTRLNYEPKVMLLTDAYVVIDQMIMTQHREWKPDSFVITDNYLGWGYGTASNSRSSGVVYNDAISGSSSNISDRVYFNKVKGLRLLDWTRKFKHWYVVTLVGRDGNVVKHILHTRNASDAQFMMDAMAVLLKNRAVSGNGIK